MKKLLVALIFSIGLSACASGWKESAEIEGLFRDAEATGTFVLLDAGTGKLTGYNRSRAKTRFVPASTFKIPNSLIGLSAGAVKSVDEVLPYGGQTQVIKAWEMDMGLREAITMSNVPVYQELARRIGVDSMRDNLANLNFGNNDIGARVDRFWLDGPLQISAIEQASFLSRLARNQLPVSAEVQSAVREIVLLEQGEGWRLYGKTGWENAPEPGVGWWVGWVEKEDNLFPFAMNMDIHQASDAGKRVELGMASLKALGVL
ncbi:class D beta-lactamase [Natronospira bacteriovora]|uniref:Beta-lactamase n=1 Tax=Natronospira bacteriovora TaxID=3069753 RepID=A0ABU0W9E9_9GAMM|nr:class D beta-lactamase [Natronospira sp. AB-CW4]MDQ2070655.1 class D beta-lactamase [Natronospira sp. AB-CW4]